MVVSTQPVLAPVPRWADTPAGSAPSVAELAITVAQHTGRSVRELARHRSVATDAVLLAAHAKVLAALSGADTVTVATGTPTNEFVVRRLIVPGGTWAQLLHRAADATEVDLPAETALTTMDRPVPTAERPLHLVAAWTGDRLDLRLVFRTDAIGAAQADRIAGYHRTALAALLSTPDSEHENTALVDAAETATQVHDWAGPHRPLPDRRFHELFEDRAAQHPDAIALVAGFRSLSYAELNRHANRIAWRLLNGGLRREEPVAVVCERTPEWAAAVLGVFKAGGVYLPVEPHFPAERVASMLGRAECRLVLAEPSDAATAALAATDTETPIPVMLDAPGDRDDNPGVGVTADQLAYLYFTSGSTGQPKGVLCEHAGMLNHLYAKIEDVPVVPAAVVAQIAPQCFDISLWQLVSALLVGGTTVIVGQETLLDIGRFLAEITARRVKVMQVVPSYLEVLLTHVEATPHPLPDLTSVSVTGEPLKKPVVQRWFAAYPDIALVNAYGLTETSDDTNHEVMTEPPATDRVPLGRPVRNAHIYLLDERQRPVPLGAPGEIVFSGVCVGRGYINDPERTARAYLSDPLRPGERAYRSGDFGRWLPDGRLEFLGRRDAQVKVRGFRIEIGEIENRLSALPGVRDCAVIVRTGADGAGQLAAYHSGADDLTTQRLRAFLAETLPDYMVPTTFQWLPELPLSGSGKVDRKALSALESTVVQPDSRDESVPVTATERRLRDAWAGVLGVPADRIRRTDHFFDLGGTSLQGIRLAISLDRVINLKDLAAAPVLADLATTIDNRLRATAAPADN